MKDNGLSIVYVFPKKKVIYLGGQVGNQAWKFGRHWVKADRIGDPTGRNVEPWFYWELLETFRFQDKIWLRDFLDIFKELNKTESFILLFFPRKLNTVICTEGG